MSPFGGWPAGRRAAISLSFDDALLSQLENAIPVLDRYGLRGTFYVNPGEGSFFERHIDAWREVHAQGHELGNHTIAHPCSGRHPFTRPERALERWTLEQIEADIDAASERLAALIHNFGPVSFAYPCGESFVGEGPSQTSYIPSVARRFTAARGVASADNDPLTCDLHNLSSWLVTGVDATQLIRLIEPTVAAGRWGIFCFHGIGGDHLSVETESLEGLVRYLKDREGEIWVDTVYAVGRYLREASMTGRAGDDWGERSS